MDLQSVKSTYEAKWMWARTGALILFLVTAILLIASLTANRSQASSDAMLKVGTGMSVLHHFTKAS